MIAPFLFIAKTEDKGWGVFTNETIEANTVLEMSPAIVMTKTEKELLDKTTLFNYIFDWDNDKCCMAMGYVPVYNHACPSNCEYIQDFDEETIYIKSMRRIEAGEELTINYQGDYDNDTPVWFEVKV